MRHLLFAAILFYPAAATAARVERFDASGATLTCGTAVASNGLVAGVAAMATAVVGTSASRAVAAGPFLDRFGHFVSPRPAVPAGTVSFTDVNRARAITGTDLDSAAIATQAFTFAAGVTRFPSIAQGPVTSLAGITDAGTTLGTAATRSGPLGFGVVVGS